MLGLYLATRGCFGEGHQLANSHISNYQWQKPLPAVDTFDSLALERRISLSRSAGKALSFKNTILILSDFTINIRATTELASRVADEMGVALGEEVGYKIRNDQRCSI